MINNDFFSLLNFDGDLVDFFEQGRKSGRSRAICPSCGYEFQNYLETGRLGCSKCYDVFHDEIVQTVESLRGDKIITNVPAGRESDKMVDALTISSRVRLARNLEEVPFKTQQKGAFDGIAATIKKNNAHFASADTSALPREMATALYEQHLISRELLANKANSVIVTRTDNRVVCMLGEEDHVRIQALMTGFDIETAYATAKKIADDIVAEHKIARRKDFGFLTSCPSNLGTGMRASVMLFLPALTITDRINGIIEQLSNANLTVRGDHGEGSESRAYLYQISNQACFGMTEREILDMVRAVAVQIAVLERNAEAELLKTQGDEIADAVFRAWGLLTNAFMLATAEAVENLAMLKLGANLGIIKFKNTRIIDDLFFTIQPQTLVTVDNRAAAVRDRDKIRAQKIAEVLKQTRV
jgi:protein arginine kinase